MGRPRQVAMGTGVLAVGVTAVVLMFAPVDQSIRETPEVRHAMAAYHAAQPNCEWCGGSEKVETHHAQAIWLNPALAADTNNMVSLCRKHGCHLIVGHAGNYGRRAVTNVKQIVAMRVIVERKPNGTP